jgi:type I restriction enzyme, S subunit
MAGEWPVVEIGTVAKIFDGPHATPPTIDDGPIFLGIDALNDGRLDLSETRHVSEKTFAEWTRRVVPQAGDLVFSYETRIGQAALIPTDLRCCLGRRLALARPLTDALNSRYLLYYYLSPRFQTYLKAHTMPGSTVDRIHLTNFPKFPIVLPPRGYQDQIAEILGSLDDKIELNQRMAVTLEATAQALFQSWIEREGESGFVSVQDLINDQILQIGDGYRAKNDELAAPGLPFLRAANLNGGINIEDADTLCEASVLNAGSKLSRPGDVAFTSKGTVGRFARVDERTPKFVYSPQVCFWRSLDSTTLHPALLYLTMRSSAFLAQIEQAAGQTDMAPYVSLQDQRRMVLPLLPSGQKEFGEQLQWLLSRQAALIEENLTLSDLHDTLLPKLLSGDLRIADAESRIVAA